MNIMQFVTGLLTGMIIGSWFAWSAYKREMDDWKRLFEEILPQVAGYKNLKDRIREGRDATE